MDITNCEDGYPLTERLDSYQFLIIYIFSSNFLVYFSYWESSLEYFEEQWRGTYVKQQLESDISRVCGVRTSPVETTE